MTVEQEVFAYQGGLDLVTPPLQVTPGRLVESINYEVLPEGGIRRIDGYVLYDGSEAAAAVPGEGPIRGVWVYADEVYAFRDQASAGGFFRESAAGWTAVALGSSLRWDGGQQEIFDGDTVTGGTSGATATVVRNVHSGGLFSDQSAFGLITLTGITGTFADNETLSTGAGVAAQANGAVFANTLPKGGIYDFANHNFFGNDDNDRMYGANGVGYGFSFDGTNYTPIEDGVVGTFPHYVTAHKDHLMWGYREGSIVTSGIGNPLSYNAIDGASEIAVGDALTGFKLLAGGVLAIGCEDSINFLYGNDAESWQRQQFTEHGVRPRTFGEIGGNVLVLDDRGVQNVATTQAFGDFEAVTQSRAINPLLLKTRSVIDASASVVNKNKSQYRLFYGSLGFYFVYAGAELSGITPVQYDDPVRVACNGEDSQGREIVFFGSDDGKVFQMDTGFNFNGAPIVSFARAVFNHQRQPTRRKQYRRVVLQAQGEGGSADINIKADFDFAGTHVPSVPFITAGAGDVTDGGSWNLAIWDAFNWSGAFYATLESPLYGIGRNMALTVQSTGEEDVSHTIYSAVIHYSMRRLDR